MEGAAALFVAFLLLALVVQVVLLVGARTSAQAAVDSFARRAAASPGAPASDLAAEARAALPGAQDVEASVVRTAETVQATLEFSWDPPGPRFVPIRVRVVGLAPVVNPP